MKSNKTIGAPSNKIQQRRSFESSAINQNVRDDDTTAPEKRGECFSSSAHKSILDKKPGFGTVKPTLEDHVSNRGLETLSSDSRKSPLPEKGKKIEIHQKYNDENIIYTPDASTVS